MAGLFSGNMSDQMKAGPHLMGAVLALPRLDALTKVKSVNQHKSAQTLQDATSDLPSGDCGMMNQGYIKEIQGDKNRHCYWGNSDLTPGDFPGAPPPPPRQRPAGPYGYGGGYGGYGSPGYGSPGYGGGGYAGYGGEGYGWYPPPPPGGYQYNRGYGYGYGNGP
ncbi:unnamed protein product, partial [Symbiodinium natans]